MNGIKPLRAADAIWGAVKGMPVGAGWASTGAGVGSEVGGWRPAVACSMRSRSSLDK